MFFKVLRTTDNLAALLRLPKPVNPETDEMEECGVRDF